MTVTFTTENLPENIAFVAETDDYRITARRRYGEAARTWTREGRKTTRVYGAMDALAPELMALEPYRAEGYLIPVGPDRSPEDEVRSAVWSGWKNRTVRYVNERLMLVLEDVFADTAYAPDFTTETPRFSFNAGCSACPCSPGMILPTRMTHNGIPFDLDIEAKVSSVVEESPAS